MKRLACASAFAVVFIIAGCGGSFSDEWRQAKAAAHEKKLVKVASSRKDDPACKDANRVLEAVPLLTGAIAARAYGDALQVVADYERRLLCLNVASHDMVDHLLTKYMRYAATRDGLENRVALLQALFQLGALTFDQRTAPRQNSWQAALKADQASLTPAIQGYPNTEFGLWTYDLRRGELFRLPYKDSAWQLFEWLTKSKESSKDDCFVAELQQSVASSPGASTTGSSATLLCTHASGKSGKTSDGSAGRDGPLLGGPNYQQGPGTDPAAIVACTVSARDTSGPRGQLSCVRKAAGLERNINTYLTIGADAPSGLPDKVCLTRGDPAGDASTGGASSSSGSSKSSGNSDAGTKTSGTSDAGSKTSGTSDGGTKTSGTSDAGSKTSGTSDGGTKTSETTDAGTKTSGTSDAGSGSGKSSGMAEPTPSSCPTCDKVWNWMKKAVGGGSFEVETERAACCRGQPVDEEAAAKDPCSDPTGATARFTAAYQCLSSSATADSGAGRPRDSDLILTTDPTGTLSSQVSCLAQGGDLIRKSSDDASCAVARCVQGEDCVCNRINRDPTQVAAAVGQQRNVCRQYAYCSGDGPCECDSIGQKPPGGGGGVPPAPPKK